MARKKKKQKDRSILFVVDLQEETLRRLPQSVFRNTTLLLENKDKFGIGDVVVTRFFNTHESLFVQELNWRGCMKEDEDSHIPQELLEFADWLVDKPTYGMGSDMLHSLFQDILGSDRLPKYVYLAGTDLDACIYAIALELWDLGIVPRIILPCTSTTSVIPNAFENGVALLGRQIGKHNLIHNLDELHNQGADNDSQFLV